MSRILSGPHPLHLLVYDQILGLRVWGGTGQCQTSAALDPKIARGPLGELLGSHPPRFRGPRSTDLESV